MDDVIMGKTRSYSVNDAPGGVKLKRELGLFSAVNLILGVMIGSGIFVSTSSALEHSGSVGMCIAIWIVCGIISLLGALGFAELGTVVPRSGADYAYFMESFGPLHRFWGRLPAFLCSWMYVVALRPAEVAVIIMTFSEYVCEPILFAIGMDDQESEVSVKKLISLLALATITFINLASVKLYVKLQNVFSSCKVIACLVVIAGGAYELYNGRTEHLSKGFEGTNLDAKNIALALYSGLWAYDGWNAVTTVTEEVKHPEKNILRSIVISVPIVIVLYVFMNISYLTAMSVPEIVEASAVACVFGERVLGPFRLLIPLGVAISTFGCALSVQFGVTRVCYVSSQDGHMLESLSYIHYKRLTPVPAVIMQGLISYVYLVSGDIVQLIQFASFLVWIGYGTCMVSLLVLRRTKKDASRPYRVPTAVVVFILLVAIFLAGVPIVTDPTPKYLFAIGFLMLGAVVYYFFIYHGNRPRIMNKITYLIQVLFEVVPPDGHTE